MIFWASSSLVRWIYSDLGMSARSHCRRPSVHSFRRAAASSAARGWGYGRIGCTDRIETASYIAPARLRSYRPKCPPPALAGKGAPVPVNKVLVLLCQSVQVLNTGVPGGTEKMLGWMYPHTPVKVR